MLPDDAQRQTIDYYNREAEVWAATHGGSEEKSWWEQEMSRFHELDFPEGTFDGFWTAATLLHIPKARIDGALTKIKGVVKPGGIGFISMKQGLGEKTDEKTGRWFAYYSRDEFKKVLEKNRFEVIETRIRPTEKDTWLSFYVRA